MVTAEEDEDEPEREEEEEEEETTPLPTAAFCIIQIQAIERYLLAHDREGKTVESVQNIKTFLTNSKAGASRQAKISDMFSSK